MNSADKRLNGIDITKFILVFFIIAIHASTVNNTVSYVFVNGICRIAVPYYFIVSGYFCFKKSTSNGKLNSSYVFSYLKKIFRLYVIWTLIYMPVIVQGMIADNPKGHNAFYIAVRWFVLQFSLSGSYAHLWYLNATLLAIIIVGILLKLKIKPAAIFIASLFIYVIGLLGDSYHGLIENTIFDSVFSIYCKIFSSTRNWLFLGFPFISIGMILSQNEKTFSSVKTVPALILSMAILIAEVLFTYQKTGPSDYNAYLLLPVVSVLLFIVTINLQMFSSYSFRMLRDIGVLMFFSHMYIKMGVDHFIVEKLCNMSVQTFNQYLRYSLVCFISFVVSWGIYKLSFKVKILNELY